MKTKLIKLKRLEFLEDTVKYYSEDITRRSFRSLIGGSQCLYRKKENGVTKYCAIGRHIPMKTDLENCNTYAVEELYNLGLLPSKLKKLGLKFLEQIQSLHDKSENWNQKGLTGSGLGQVEFIKQKWNLI